MVSQKVIYPLKRQYTIISVIKSLFGLISAMIGDALEDTRTRSALF